MNVNKNVPTLHNYNSFFLNVFSGVTHLTIIFFYLSITENNFINESFKIVIFLVQFVIVH